MSIRGVFLFIAVLCSSLSSSAVETASVPVAPNGRQAIQREATSPFGVPFPENGDPQAWQVWRQRVHAQAIARRTATSHPNNASGTASGGLIEAIAGAVPFQKPVNALKTGFGQIRGMTEDREGNLYIASCDLGIVLKVDSSSNTTVYAEKPMATGPAASSGDGGPATSARILCPSGLAIDTTGNLYLSDISSGTIREVDAATGIIHTIAGIAGQRDDTGDGGAATAAKVENPQGLALDGMGNLFIQDSSYVREVNLSTGIIGTVVGSSSTPLLVSFRPRPTVRLSMSQ